MRRQRTSRCSSSSRTVRAQPPASKDEQYLQAAERFAEQGTKLFFAESSPLPKASHQHDHYEAATNGDTLLMALLQLWQIGHRPDVRVQLLHSDR